MPTQINKAECAGVFSVVATPIGNLGDFTLRGIETLKSATLILAEDTRHSRPLLNHYGITTQLKACHEHNEASLVSWVAEQLNAGASIALISDAGTPLISDPGFLLVRALRELGHRIDVVPGPSSVIAALSVAGLPTDHFIFDGFLPAKSAARQQALKAYQAESRTIVLLESSHRIERTLADVVTVLGADRTIVVARELTKKFETVLAGNAAEIAEAVSSDANQQKGEFVLLLSGVTPQLDDGLELERTLRVLLDELPVKQAAGLAAKLCGAKKNYAYKLALDLKDNQSSANE